jgi:hypothetical protein
VLTKSSEEPSILAITTAEASWVISKAPRDCTRPRELSWIKDMRAAEASCDDSILSTDSFRGAVVDCLPSENTFNWSAIATQVVRTCPGCTYMLLKSINMLLNLSCS